LFTLKTHRHLFAGEAHDALDLGEQPWTKRASIIVLTVVTCLVALMSEMLVGAMEPASHQLGLTQVFVGVILVALVGNAAEHSTAVMVALKNKMDLAYGIAVGSSLQIALLVAPLLVFASYLFGTPLDLIFTPFEVAAVTILGPDCGIRGDGRRIELDGRCDVGRSVPDAGDRLFPSARLAQIQW
jgi:Ca2+:H+ antiporter